MGDPCFLTPAFFCGSAGQTLLFSAKVSKARTRFRSEVFPALRRMIRNMIRNQGKNCQLLGLTPFDPFPFTSWNAAALSVQAEGRLHYQLSCHASLDGLV